jgi:hypothetical protein
MQMIKKTCLNSRIHYDNYEKTFSVLHVSAFTRVLPSTTATGFLFILFFLLGYGLRFACKVHASIRVKFLKSLSLDCSSLVYPSLNRLSRF